MSLDTLDTGALGVPYSPYALQAILGRPDADVLAALERLEAKGVTNRAAAALLRALDEGLTAAHKPDLVWSGPEVGGLHSRDTRRVYEEMFASAKRSLWAVTFAYFDGPRVFDLLAKRMETIPELRVTLLLNIHRGHRDTSRREDVIRRFADQFWEKDWPGTIRPNVFYDPRSVDPKAPGVLHAKAVVADEDRVFVTSANFTGAALDHNIELGLLVRDRPLALSVVKHLQGRIGGLGLKADNL